MKKFAFNVLSSATLLATAAVPVVATVAPIAASAATTKTVVYSTPSITTDFESPVGTVASPAAPLTTMDVSADDIGTNLVGGQTFRITLPSGVKFVTDDYATGAHTSDSVTGATYTSLSDQVIEFKVNNTTPAPTKVHIPLFVKVDGAAAGPVNLTVDGLDSSVAGGTYTIATVNSGKSVTTVDSVENIASGTTQKVGNIRIDESAVGALNESGWQKVTLKLPTNYNWYNDSAATSPAQIVLGGGFAGVAQVARDASGTGATSVGTNSVNLASYIESGNDRAVTFYLKTNSPSTRGTLYVNGAQVSADSDAVKGDVTLSVDGDKVTGQDVVVATNSDYGVSTKIDQVNTIVAGRNDSDSQYKTGQIDIKENVVGSLVAGRNLEIDLPSNVKVSNVGTIESDGDWSISTANLNSDRNKITYVVPTHSSKLELKVKLPLEIESDVTGDIHATIKGAGIADQDLVIAKAVAPVTLSASTSNVTLGAQGQAAGDITLTEGAAGAIKKNGGVVHLELPEGVSFSSTPTVTVTNGDVEIDPVSVTTVTANGTSGGALEFQLKGESTKASTITISGVKLTVDRSVPAGPISLKVKGSAIVNTTTTTGSGTSAVTVQDFSTSTAAKTTYANVVTPSAGGAAAFTIGKTTYTVNGVQQTLDVAPYTKAGRTYLPIRFVAEALGISDNNIIWNDATKTVTIIGNNGAVAQFTVGQSHYTVNGAVVPMDAAAEFVQNRNMIPLRYAAQAVGAQVNWDDATQTVTINPSRIVAMSFCEPRS